MTVWIRPGFMALAVAPLAACAPPKPAAPPPPSTGYAKVMLAAMASPGRGRCLNEAETETVRGRIIQQELAFAARHCNMIGDYNRFATKFTGDLQTNGRQLQTLLRRRGININTFVTDIANKTATARRGPIRATAPTRARPSAGPCSPRRRSLTAVPPL